MRSYPAPAFLQLFGPAFLRHASNALLVTALALGAHARWLSHSPSDADVTSLVLLATVVITVAVCAVVFAQRLQTIAPGETVGEGFVRLITGCLIGIVGLTPNLNISGEERVEEGSGRLERSVWTGGGEGGAGESGFTGDESRREWAMNVAFCASAGLRLAWAVINRVCGVVTPSGSKVSVFDPMDALEVSWLTKLLYFSILQTPYFKSFDLTKCFI